MDTVQVVLLAAGVAIIAGIYFFSFRKRPSRTPVERADAPPPRGTNVMPAAARAEPAVLGKSSTSMRYSTEPATQRPSRRVRQRAPELIIQLLVVGRDGRRFRGPDVVNAIQHNGLTLDDMDIFHCVAAGECGDEAMFSIANMMEPGTFNMNFIDHFETPGLALFMTLPGPVEGKSAFNRLLATARQLAADLHGEVRDQSRSVLTQQGVEHLLEQITEFERKRQVESRRIAHG